MHNGLCEYKGAEGNYYYSLLFSMHIPPAANIAMEAPPSVAIVTTKRSESPATCIGETLINNSEIRKAQKYEGCCCCTYY